MSASLYSKSRADLLLKNLKYFLSIFPSTYGVDDALFMAVKEERTIVAIATGFTLFSSKKLKITKNITALYDKEDEKW